MTYEQTDLFSGKTKEENSIEILQAWEPKDGYYVAFSGGKDSIVTLDLVRRAGVKHTVAYNVTSVDPPEVIHFIRDNYPETIFQYSGTTMWDLIVKKRLPPTRVVRYCCQVLKEQHGRDFNAIITGVRREESSRRANNCFVEDDRKKPGCKAIRPIVDWTTKDIWCYINDNNLKYPSLYDEGFTRLGCIMCPLGGSKKAWRDAQRWPNYAFKYLKACRRCYDKRIKDGLPGHWTSGDEIFDWWLSRPGAAKEVEELYNKTKGRT